MIRKEETKDWDLKYNNKYKFLPGQCGLVGATFSTREGGGFDS